MELSEETGLHSLFSLGEMFMLLTNSDIWIWGNAGGVTEKNF